MNNKPSRNLATELVRATEAAALAAPWLTPYIPHGIIPPQ